jgi:hypothetical protein
MSCSIWLRRRLAAERRTCEDKTGGVGGEKVRENPKDVLNSEGRG